MAKREKKGEEDVLTAGTEPVSPAPAEDQAGDTTPDPEPTVDEQVNTTGNDALTIEKPVEAVVTINPDVTVGDLRAALRTLAGMVMSPADFQEIQNLQPRIFGE